MPKSIEDILVHIHDRTDEDENTKLGRTAREVDIHLVAVGRNTTPERLRLAKAFKDSNVGTRLGDRIVGSFPVSASDTGDEGLFHFCERS